MKTGEKIYFVSDAHLGANSIISSEERERMLISWLDEIKNDAAEIFFLGDIFDFWFEYKYFVPKNYILFLAKLRELSDSGIKINFFTGNHDMWTYGYLAETCKLNVYYDACILKIGGKNFYMGHGDGLGPYDKKYNFIKIIFRSTFCRFLFKTIHPSISFRLAHAWSNSNRKKHRYVMQKSIDHEYLVKYARKILETENINFFVFGHRHIPLQVSLNDTCMFTNIGDWLINFTYGEYDGEKIVIKKYYNLEKDNNG